LVHNINGVTKFLKTKEVYKQHQQQNQANQYNEIIISLRQKSVYELLQIARKAKNRHHRVFAVHLLGKQKNKRSEIISHLREIVAYEHRSVKNEAIWALAKLGDRSIQSLLFEIYSTDMSELEKSLTVKMLGKIGDKKSIEFLLDVSANSRNLTGLNAGSAIHEIIDKIGIQPLIHALENESDLIRQEAIWILCARCKFLSNKKEKNSIINALVSRLELEDSIPTRVALCYNLSILNIPEASQELLVLCVSGQIPNDRQLFFLNEVIRAFIYRQKESSLKLVKKLNTAIETVDARGRNISTSKLVSRLEKSIKNLDKIFEII
jgi:hypothetical protein